MSEVLRVSAFYLAATAAALYYRHRDSRGSTRADLASMRRHAHSRKFTSR